MAFSFSTNEFEEIKSTSPGNEFFINLELTTLNLKYLNTKAIVTVNN